MLKYFLIGATSLVLELFTSSSVNAQQLSRVDIEINRRIENLIANLKLQSEQIQRANRLEEARRIAQYEIDPAVAQLQTAIREKYNRFSQVVGENERLRSNTVLGQPQMTFPGCWNYHPFSFFPYYYEDTSFSRRYQGP